MELFKTDYYNVAFRLRGDDNANSDREWTIVKSSNHEWFADPFVFECNGRHFIFAERMDKWHTVGTVAYCEILADGTSTPFKEVMTESFHLSFPNVFEYRGTVYMIPETGHSNDIRLYRAVQFPEQWELVKVLTTGANFVDTSFISDIQGGRATLFSFDWDNRRSHFYRFDLDELSLTELPANHHMMNERSGGNYFEKDGVGFRVLQDCSRTYGEKLIINRIENGDFGGGHAADSLSFEIRPQDLRFKGLDIKPKCCHTYNRSAKYEVVDFLAERFVWFLPYLTLRRKVRSAYYKLRRLLNVK